MNTKSHNTLATLLLLIFPITLFAQQTDIGEPQRKYEWVFPPTTELDTMASYGLLLIKGFSDIY